MRCFCGKEFEGIAQLVQHNEINEPHINRSYAPFYIKTRFHMSAVEFKRSLGKKDNLMFYDLETVFSETQPFLFEMLSQYNYRAGYCIAINTDLGKFSSEGEWETVNVYFNCKTCLITSSEEFCQQYRVACEQIRDKVDDFCEHGSGFTFLNSNAIYLTIYKYRPARIGCKQAVPEDLANRTRSFLNIADNSGRCFELAVLASCFPQCEQKCRPQQYLKLQHAFKFPQKFPITVRDVYRFVENNKEIGLTVIEYNSDEKSFYPIICNKNKNCHFVVDLLLFESHFFAIVNFNALLRPSNTRNTAVSFCRNCLSSFVSIAAYENHFSLCANFAESIIVRPKNPYIIFNYHGATIRLPFFAVLDTESIALKDSSHTNVYAKHVVSSYCLYLIRSIDNQIFKRYEHFGKDSSERLVDDIADAVDTTQKLNPHVKIIYTYTDRLAFEKQKFCGICKKVFSWNNVKKVRHHDHSNGLYIEALCSSCNFLARPLRELVILVHNLSFDVCFFIRNLHKLSRNSPFIVASSSERIRFLKYDTIVSFVDSMQYVNASLEKLVSEHCVSQQPFNCVDSVFGQNSTLMQRKGVFCYDYVSSWEAYSLSTLPTISSFRNSLLQSPCSVHDYLHAQNVFKQLKCKTLKDYSMAYLRSDVALLADCMLSIREQLFLDYKLDLFCFISLPHFAFTAAMYMTGAIIDLFEDIDMYLFIESSVRGGITQQSCKFTRANNQSCPDYNPSVSLSHILYIDVNSMYAHAMCKCLPIGEYSWSDDDLETILQTPNDGDYGYFVSIDFHYPVEIQEKTRDFPLAPYHDVVRLEQLSEFQQMQADDQSMGVGKSRKLLLTCKDQTNYILHFILLKTFVDIGMKITRINKVLKFRQTKVFEPFIKFNAEKRKSAVSASAKNMYKLMTNALYGKCLYRSSKQKEFSVVHSQQQFNILSKRLSIDRLKLLDENVALFQHKKRVVEIKFPSIIGSAILDLSKAHMYDSYYNGFKKHLTHVEMMYIDTDSFVLYCCSDNLFDELETLKPTLLDCSNLQQDHPLNYEPNNAGKLGMFKFENGQSTIQEVVFLRPKMYSIKYIDQNVKRAKGVKKHVVNDQLRHEHYVETLRTNIVKFAKQRFIRSIDLENFNMEINKKTLSSFCDKRFQLDAIRSVPHYYQGKSFPPSLTFYNVPNDFK